ncbi:PREDICTED: uncharacterized protein LOC106110794 [Papilio polytes]|uniref:uncharacterized protein LOC106110794 n=1 Tax=Papilio polytes TaxID=76194 RepID=UPI000675FED9|nr:PREDICTED: uncharacterized protein LOC106110794 [Papilio polytes]
MPEDKYSWRKIGEWRTRYSKLYSTPSISLKSKEDVSRISFMGNEIDPYAMLLQKMRSLGLNEESKSKESSSQSLSTFVSALNEMYDLKRNSELFQDLGVHDTMLLNLVRQQSSELRESQDQTIDLPREHHNDTESETTETCNHGMSIRMTDRSVSRSRFSRVSTRRDMDIPSILAHTANISAPEPQPGLPIFEKKPSVHPVELPKWSIRRSVCPVCSQKWKDKSFLKNIKYSGLKRNSSVLLPSVVAPARLRTIREYAPRPLSSEIRELNSSRGSFRNSSGSWQLVRARRIRIPKSLLPIEEKKLSNSNVTRSRINVEQRLKKFLSNNNE